jgi:hypothetical protein
MAGRTIMNTDDVTAEERDRLRRARVDSAPPRALEDRTVEALRQRGLLRRSRRPLIAVAWPAAAAALLAAGVTWMAMHRSSSTGAVATGPRFVLLLYAGTEPVTGTADARRREYAQWARDIASRGVAISGEELSEEAHEIPTSAGGASTPSPLPRGFFIVEAADLASAERLASTCPHLRYGGRIVVKRIVS